MSDSPAYPKRLIEVDLPIKRISAHARREKSIRHGHISTLHIWWARRPLAACRAVILASLWPDPADPLCPPRFLEEARTSLEATLGGQTTVNVPKRDYSRPMNVRAGLLDFIAEFANWDNSTNKDYLGFSRHLVQVAHESLGGTHNTRPLVVDPFAGGGSIPLEALRVGADAFASDLNPVAVLLNKVVLEYIPKYGQRLADEVRKRGAWVKEQAEKELGEFFPQDSDGAAPIAFLWARTIISEAPDHGDIPVEVPLIRSMWLAKKSGRNRALRWIRDTRGQVATENVRVSYANGAVLQVRRPLLEVFEPSTEKEVEGGTVARGSATCPVTGYTTPVVSVRRQLKERTGGSRDSRMFCVVTTKLNSPGRHYRVPIEGDIQAAEGAARIIRKSAKKYNDYLSEIPNEKLDIRGIRHTWSMIYGMNEWSDFFSPRQLYVLVTLSHSVREMGGDNAPSSDSDFANAVQSCLALAVDRQADALSSLVTWTAGGEFQGHTFARQALPMVWDYAEINPFSKSSGNFMGAVEWVSKVCEANIDKRILQAVVEPASAVSHPLPDDSAHAMITDPPYYDAVPYSYLSDFFYVWLRRCLAKTHPSLFREPLTPKDEEIIVDRAHELSDSKKNIQFYERQLGKAFAECRRVLRPDGIGTIVFASKTTASWEAILSAVIDAGWIVTGSWPIDTEREARVSAIDQARLASSIHLVCRPREEPDGSLRDDDVGDWRDVLEQLPRRIHEWMPRLAEEGVVGADAIFACLGPALEVFSRYSRVEKASGEAVSLKEYLVEVWAAVANEALSLIFKDADSGGLEPDARLTAMWLWTLSAGGTGTGGGSTSDDESVEESSEDEDEETTGKTIKGEGFSLEFDAARKIAQGLGANFDELRTVVEVKGKTARLLPVSERAKYLFGKGEGQAVAAPEKSRSRAGFLKGMEDVSSPVQTSSSSDEIGPPKPGLTVLDRVHQAMILFGSGRAEALKSFVVEEGAGTDARFWKLAQSFSALYPPGTVEKRWVDGVLARKKGLGF